MVKMCPDSPALVPTHRSAVAILTLSGPRLGTKAQIASNIYRPYSTHIPFFVEVPNLSFVMSLPRWNTHSSNFGNRIGKVGFFRIDASYLYFAEVREDNVEQFTLDITVRNLPQTL